MSSDSWFYIGFVGFGLVFGFAAHWAIVTFPLAAFVAAVATSLVMPVVMQQSAPELFSGPIPISPISCLFFTGIAFPVTCLAGLPFWAVRKAIEVEPNECKQCRYDLTGNTSGLCPECGTPIRHDPEC